MIAHLISRRTVYCLAVLCFFAPAWSGHAAAQTNREPSVFRNLHFRDIGPATMSGRIDDFAVLESDPTVFYVATATGGVWKTTNNGTTFAPVFDGQATSSIGDVAIAPADANLVWVGTGENNNRQSSSWGEGVFQSTDGGRSWRNRGLLDSRHIARIIVDPVDHDVVYVAALGNLWAPGGERGVYKTTDAGESWDRVLHVDDDTGATDLVMDPSNNKVLYAAMYQRRRSPWGFNGGGPGSGIHKSTDAGRTWTRLTAGLPDGPMGRIGLDIYRRDPNVLYARIEHPQGGGIYRTDDAGGTWEKRSDTNPRPMYFSQIRIDPMTDSRIYVLGVQLHVSDDGGRTFRDDGADRIHVDFHAMWIDPRDSRHLMLGGDGGVGISYDRSETYVFLNNLSLGQFYHVSYDFESPYTVCGGLQDNNSWCGPSAVRASVGIVNDDWFIVGGGDGFVALIDPEDSRVMYAESQGGRMNRVDRTTNERKVIRPEPEDGADEYRWNWDTPLVMSPHDPATIFVAANHVFRSSDRGHSWSVVSPDLTRAIDRDELELMGVAGKDTTIARNDGVGAFGTITTFAESPRTPGLYYAGTDDGVVQVSSDAGATWTNVTDAVPGLPERTYVSRVEPSHHADGTVYVTFDGHRAGDFGSHVYASTDRGASWTSIAAGLPAGQVARTISEDLRNPDVLYLGTETGVFVSVDRGKQWLPLDANLPTVPVYEITLHPRDNAMILATHGRSIWVLDDLTPIQELARARQSSHVVFPSSPASLRRPGNSRTTSVGDRQFFGENPPAGAVLTYYLDAPADDFTIAIADASGTTVRTLSGESVADQSGVGINRVVWDLRLEPLPELAGLSAGNATARNAPLVMPGRYQVTLHSGERAIATGGLDVVGDPDIQISDADRRLHHEASRDLHTMQRRADAAAAAAVDLHERLESIRETLDGRTGAAESALARVDELVKEVDALRVTSGLSGRTGGPQNVRGQIGQLKNGVMNSTSVPTETQTRLQAELRAKLDRLIADANATIERVSTLIADLATQGLYPARPAPIATSPRE